VNSQADIKNWIDLESNLNYHHSPLQLEALKILDSVTNQLSGLTTGFEWASNIRVKYLRLIDKMRYPYQLEYFKGAVALGLVGFKEATALKTTLAEDLLVEGNELSEVDFAKMRVARQVITHGSEITENQWESYLKKKSEELRKIDAKEARRVRLGRTLIGRCLLKFNELKFLALNSIH
jgi:hypothetical protein